MRHLRVLILSIFGLFIIGTTIFTLSDVHGENAPLQQQSAQQISQLSLIETLGRGRINEVAWSPDETLMAIASTNGLWLYDTQDYQEIATVIDGVTVSVVAFNHDASQIAYLDSGGVAMPYRITVWDVSTQEAISSVDIDEYVTALVFSPDGLQLGAATQSGYVSLWDIQTADHIGEREFENVSLRELEFVEDYSLFVYYWNWITDSVNKWLPESETPELIRSRETSHRVVVASNGEAVVMADIEGETITVSDFETGALLSIIESPSNIYDLIFRDSRLIIVHDEGTLIWNFEESTLESELDLPHHKFDVWYSPSGAIIVYPEHNSVRILDILSSSTIAQVDNYFGTISGLSFNPTADRLAVAYHSAFHSSYVRLWQIVNSGVEASDVAQGEHYITAVTYSRDGERLAYAYVGAQLKFGITIWSAQAQASTSLVNSDCDWDGNSHVCGFDYLEFSPDNERIAGIFNIQWFTPQHNFTLGYVFDLAQQLDWNFREDDNYFPVEPSTEFVEGYFQRYLLVNFQPETNTVAYNGLSDYAVRLYDIETQEAPTTLYSHSTEVNALQFSPDGTTLVSGDADGSLIVWDMVQEQIRGNLPINDGHIEGIDFHPDSQHFAIATGDQVIIFDITTMQEVATVDHNNVEFVDFNYDGTILATANSNGLLKLWAVD